jgi:hypothetical protein
MPNKECPDDKIYNRISHRCVKKDGKVGKEILKKIAAAKALKKSPKKASKSPKKASPKKVYPKKSPKKVSPKKPSPKKVSPKKNIKPNKECPDDKVYNRISHRCVKKDGKVGKEILKKIAAAKAQKQSPKSPKTSPKKASPKKASPKKTSPKKASPKKVSPKKVSPKKVSPKKVSPKKVSPKKVSPKKVSPKKVSPKKVSYSFIEGIHILSLIKCAIKGEIDIDDINTWKVCNSNKSIYGKVKKYKQWGLDLSFLKPSEKLKDRMDVVEKVIQKSYKNFSSKFLYDFSFFLETNKISFENLYKYFNLLEGVSIERIQGVSTEKLLSYSEPHQQNLKDLLKIIYDDTAFFNLYKLADDIKNGKFRVKFGQGGCIIEDSNKIQKIEQAANLVRSIPYRMSEDFYVYRTLFPSSSYNTSEKILSIIKGEFVENYPTMISTTWDLNFALGWDSSYCCLYVIKVPKDSDYLILDDSFNVDTKDSRSEHEITLNPGTLTITDIKYLQYNKESKVIFFAEYKSYTKYELSKFLCK